MGGGRMGMMVWRSGRVGWGRSGGRDGTELEGGR